MPKISKFQLKVTHHTKTQENLNLNETNKQKKQIKSIDANTEMTEICELSDSLRQSSKKSFKHL